jgi:hypothetical protein
LHAAAFVSGPEKKCVSQFFSGGCGEKPGYQYAIWLTRPDRSFAVFGMLTDESLRANP